VTPARKFRQLLQAPGAIAMLGAHDVFSARLIEAAGMETVFLGGFSTSASMLGLPDLGYITLTEMADAVRRVVQSVTIPVVADGDTGHGDLHNVARTVREFERAGAAGLLLEDQVAPKRCGHVSGKQVIPAQEMVLKLKAARAARRDPDFTLIARTDARAVEGLEAALQRGNLYGLTGADVIFIDAPLSQEELERIPREVRYPTLAVMLTGGVTPMLPLGELDRFGYKIVLWPIETLLASGAAIQQLIQSLRTTGRPDAPGLEMMTFTRIKQVVGLEETLKLRENLERAP
jgi:2-methylisocitrate lyase-like PEP mutase family enzyme